jgi:hypothetical protein
MNSLDKFTKAYMHIISEMNGFDTQIDNNDNTKYDLILLYSINEDDVDDSNFENIKDNAFKQVNDIFTPLGGKVEGDGNEDISRYTGSISNEGQTGIIIKFNSINKDQLVKIFNTKFPYSFYDSIGDQLNNLWGNDEYDYSNPNDLVSLIKVALDEGDETVLDFKEL